MAESGRFRRPYTGSRPTSQQLRLPIWPGTDTTVPREMFFGSAPFVMAGAIALPVASLAATGTVSALTITCAGGVTMDHPILAGTGLGAPAMTGTGGVILPHPALSATASELYKASGGVKLPTPSIAATAKKVHSATGGVVLPKPTLSAAAKEKFLATGAVTTGAAALAGAGKETYKAAGGVILSTTSLAGQGTSGAARVGAGGVVLPVASMVAQGSVVAGAVTVPVAPSVELPGIMGYVSPRTELPPRARPVRLIEGAGAVTLQFAVSARSIQRISGTGGVIIEVDFRGTGRRKDERRELFDLLSIA